LQVATDWRIVIVIKQRTREKVGPLKDRGGNVLTNDEETANLLNNYFSSVFTVEDCSNIPNAKQMFTGKIGEEDLVHLEITSTIVEHKLEKLDVNKCPGLDNIHPKLLYELRSEISNPLSKLFKKSLDMGIVPSDWKEAGVTPLFKKGSKSDCSQL